jgi:hypothetical protein
MVPERGTCTHRLPSAYWQKLPRLDFALEHPDLSVQGSGYVGCNEHPVYASRQERDSMLRSRSVVFSCGYVWGFTTFVVCAAFHMQPLAADEPDQQVQENLIPTEWEQITSRQEKIEILELLVAEMSSNYGKIQTWKGAYTEHSEGMLDSKYVESRLQHLAPDSSVRTVCDAVCTFLIDCSENTCHLRVQDCREEYFLDESNEPADIGLRRATDERCVVTPEQFIVFKPEMRFGNFSSLREHDLPAKRASFRRPPKDAQLSYYSNFVDPRVFFHISGSVKLWDEYEISYLPIYRGEYGDERANEFDARLSVFKAARDETTWIRCVFNRAVKGLPPLKEYVYSSDAGFNVVRFTEWRDGKPLMLYSWQFQRMDPDAIYVPSMVDIQYAALTKRRVLTLQNCVLNEPIDPDLFTEAALELDDGDLLMDEVARVAYEWKDGEPEKLADYGEGPPKDPADAGQTDSPSRMIYALLGLAVLIGVVVAFKMASKR